MHSVLMRMPCVACLGNMVKAITWENAVQTNHLVNMDLKDICCSVSGKIPWETLTPFCINPRFSVKMENFCSGPFNSFLT